MINDIIEKAKMERKNVIQDQRSSILSVFRSFSSFSKKIIKKIKNTFFQSKKTQKEKTSR